VTAGRSTAARGARVGNLGAAWRGARGSRVKGRQRARGRVVGAPGKAAGRLGAEGPSRRVRAPSGEPRGPSPSRSVAGGPRRAKTAPDGEPRRPRGRAWRHHGATGGEGRALQRRWSRGRVTRAHGEPGRPSSQGQPRRGPGEIARNGEPARPGGAPPAPRPMIEQMGRGPALVTTSRNLGVDPLQYLHDVLDRLATCSDVQQLTPHGWKEHSCPSGRRANAICSCGSRASPSRAGADARGQHQAARQYKVGVMQRLH